MASVESTELIESKVVCTDSGCGTENEYVDGSGESLPLGEAQVATDSEETGSEVVGGTPASPPSLRETERLMPNPNACGPVQARNFCDPGDPIYYARSVQPETEEEKRFVVEQMQRWDLEPAVVEQGFLAFASVAPKDPVIVAMALEASEAMPAEERVVFQTEVLVTIYEASASMPDQRPSREVQEILLAFAAESVEGPATTESAGNAGQTKVVQRLAVAVATGSVSVAASSVAALESQGISLRDQTPPVGTWLHLESLPRFPIGSPIAVANVIDLFEGIENAGPDPHVELVYLTRPAARTSGSRYSSEPSPISVTWSSRPEDRPENRPAVLSLRLRQDEFAPLIEWTRTSPAGAVPEDGRPRPAIRPPVKNAPATTAAPVNSTSSDESDPADGRTGWLRESLRALADEADQIFERNPDRPVILQISFSQGPVERVGTPEGEGARSSETERTTSEARRRSAKKGSDPIGLVMTIALFDGPLENPTGLQVVVSPVPPALLATLVARDSGSSTDRPLFAWRATDRAVLGATDRSEGGGNSGTGRDGLGGDGQRGSGGGAGDSGEDEGGDWRGGDDVEEEPSADDEDDQRPASN